MAETTDSELSTDSIADAPIDLGESLPEIVDWIPQFAVPYWNMIAQYPIIGAIVIASVFYILAFILREFLIRSIGRLVRNTSTDLDDRVLTGLKKNRYSMWFFYLD